MRTAAFSLIFCSVVNILNLQSYFEGVQLPVFESVTARLSSVGTHTAKVEVTDVKGAPASDTATAVVEDMVWDALVLYRRVNVSQGSGSWDYHVSGVQGWFGGDEKMRERARKSNQINMSDYVKDTGDLIGGIKYGSKFMRPLAKQMAAWVWGNKHKELSDMVVRKKADDGIIILSKLNPATGVREYKLGFWKDFAPNQTPLGDNKGDPAEHGLHELKNKWQKDDGRSVRIGKVDYKVNVVGYQYSSSPVILDLAGIGEPDLLAGAEAWRKGRKGPAVVGALREFDLDGKGPRPWEWAGPTAGILVWGGGRSGPVTAERLFGNRTWGKDWADGYRPLEALDKDGDGWLRGEETKDVHVWVDANSNAINEPGEIKTLAEHGITEIAVAAERDEEGNAWAKDGFRRNDGTTGRSWDWWSLAGELAARTGVDGTPKGEPSVYAWGPLEEDSTVEGGVFMFMHDDEGGLGLVSIVPIKESFSDDGSEGAMLGLPFTVERDGDRLRWKAVQGDTEILTSAVLEKGDIVGVTRMVREGKEELRYSWAAKPVSGPAL